MTEEKDRYLKKLSFFGKPYLKKLIIIFHHEEIGGTNPELRLFLVDNYLEELKKFYEYIDYINEIRFNHLLQVICKEYPEKIKEIEKFNNSKQFVIFLYENNTVEKLEEIINKSRIEKGRIKDIYILTPENEIKISEIKNKIKGFIEKWNAETPWKLNIKTNQNGDKFLKLFFYVEKGREPFREFIFRREDISYQIPEGLEVSKSLTYPVYIKSCEFQKLDNKNYKLTLPFPEESWFKAFLVYIFGNYKFEKSDKKYIAGLTNNVKSKLDTGPNYNTAVSAIEDIKKNIETLVNNSSLPKKRKNEINKIIKSINYCSPRLKNEVRSGIDDFIWLANFDKCDKVIPYTKRIIQEIYDKIPESRDSFFLIIGDNRKPILFEKGEITRKANLSEDEEIGLKIFIGGEDAIKEIS